MTKLSTRAVALACVTVALCLAARAQTPQPSPNATATPSRAASNKSGDGGDGALEAVRRQLREQQDEIERLRAAVAEQTRLLGELLARTQQGAETTNTAQMREATYSVYSVDGVAVTGAFAAQQSGGAAAKNPQTEQPLEARVSALEQQSKKSGETLSKLGAVTFSGDVRLRYESQFGLLNALPNAENPSIVGNELSQRSRARVRARLALRGQIGKQFDWGLRLATGTTPDVISTNQTLTDFFGRKSFAVDQAFVSYKPSRVPGLRLQAGKFETPWLFTEMTIDNDLMPEGLNETYSRDFRHAGALKNLTLVAWQLPMLERAPGFVLASNGQLDADASRRAGRDLALYGAQARARFDLTKHTALTVSAADLNFNGTQFITPAQVFGASLQVPVTLTIPATATTPAQTVTTTVNIPRDLLVNGSSLGLSIGSTNATNRDGRLSSGYNLVDLIGRLEWTGSKRFPVTALLDFVTNTQVRDVISTGGRVLENHENNGYWAELQVGRARERGDALFGYTFVRIEKDAILAPFNFSDILQASDVRAHRLLASYTVDPRVTLSFTAIVSQRPNGLLGPFGATPAGSPNRPTVRLQFDTLFRF
ncbi:MAG TPA: putative porin [Pyrinomonadaceae bacterium]|nr:putative porin [Pyrinomonadaceae bacterium]